MKGLFFTQIKLESNKNVGPINKIEDEISAFQKAGLEIEHINFEPISTGLRSTFIGKAFFSSLPFTYIFSKYSYKLEFTGYDFYYIRFEAADYFFTKFLQNLRKNNPKSKIIIEFPDFPNTYWMNSFFYIGLLLKDIIARKKYRKYVNRFSVWNTNINSIYGVKILHYSNGIDVSRIQNETLHATKSTEIHLVGVCSMYNFHGFDRLIIGLAEYYKRNPQKKVFFHIVGNGPGSELSKYKNLTEQNNLQQYIVFEGKKVGKELSNIMDICDFAVCSLGMYRIGFSVASSLKIREYLARGLPLVTGCDIDILMDKNFPYHVDFPNNDTPLDINKIIDFYNDIDFFNKKIEISQKVRSFAEQNCDISVTMKNVIDYINE